MPRMQGREKKWSLIKAMSAQSARKRGKKVTHKGDECPECKEERKKVTHKDDECPECKEERKNGHS